MDKNWMVLLQQQNQLSKMIYGKSERIILGVEDGEMDRRTDGGKCMVNYEMEELVPIVGKLAEKYTAFESTSVSYEKAEQLMGAVLYCIHETWQVPAREREKQGAGLMAKA